MDTGSGLMYYRARWYHPSLSRWISTDTIAPDPTNPQSLNRFTYVLGDPLKYRDPSGHLSEDEIVSYFGLETWNDHLRLLPNTGSLFGSLSLLSNLLQGTSFYRGP